jgi:hypothetical protein
MGINVRLALGPAIAATAWVLLLNRFSNEAVFMSPAIFLWNFAACLVVAALTRRVLRGRRRP